MERQTGTLSGESATESFGAALGSLLRPGDVVLLEGELGAGKTFLAGAIARGLGVPDDVPVTSPTFGLVHELEGRLRVLHADLYRLSHPGELAELGLVEASDAVLLAEWGLRFAAELGEVALVITLAIANESSREIAIEAPGPRGVALLAGLRSMGVLAADSAL